MSASTGKRYERQLVTKLRSYGLTAERVPRSVADATPVDDVVVTLEDIDDPHPDRPITRELQNGRLTVDDIIQIEVKYRSSGGYGMASLYDTHLSTVGLGSTRAAIWASQGFVTGGPASFASHLEFECINDREVDDSLPKTLMDLFAVTDSNRGKGRVDAVALRMARKPWVMCWREGL